VVDLMLDSGAFGAWTRGEQIDIDLYIAFILANAEHIDSCVNLDVIPATAGVVATQAQVEESAELSWRNLLYIEQHGVHPIPVFHQGEDFSWLRRLMDHGCPYIGISPSNNNNVSSQKQVWLDRVFDVICDEDGWPRVKTHAFGMTAVSLVQRYPWFSADSTSWVLSSARGSVMVPRAVHGVWDFQQGPLMLYMSGQSRLKPGDARDWRTCSKAERENAAAWFDHCGVSLEEMVNDCKLRALVCARFFQEFQAGLVPTPFTRHRRVLVHEHSSIGQYHGPRFAPRIIFTHHPGARWQHNILSRINEHRRLVSFAAFNARPDLSGTTLADFVSMAPLSILNRRTKNEPNPLSEVPFTAPSCYLDSELYPGADARAAKGKRQRRSGVGV